MSVNDSEPDATQGSSLRIHAERTSDELAIDWVIRDNLMQGTASVQRGDVPPGTPAPLAALVESGTVARIESREGAIRVWRPVHTPSWDGLASQVDAAVHASFVRGPWVVDTAAASEQRGSGDSRLVEGVRELLDGEVGDYITSHGGQMTLLDVSDGVVTLELSGACKGCPAATHTLRMGIETRLRDRFPELRAVVAKT
ncbi:MAG: NifU family protein [Candidatus Nanopelagicales bacterium]